jgi:ribosome-associated protein
VATSCPHRRIRIRPALVLDEAHLEWHFIRASGPGGQNVNKVATAAQLRYDARAHLPADVFARLRRIAGRRMSQDGVLTLTARAERTQERNRQQALDRLAAILRQAAEPPTPRTPTRPTAASRAQRLEGKRQRGTTKARRRRITDEND